MRKNQISLNFNKSEFMMIKAVASRLNVSPYHLAKTIVLTNLEMVNRLLPESVIYHGKELKVEVQV